VIPARQWSEYEIAAGRENDTVAKQAYYDEPLPRREDPMPKPKRAAGRSPTRRTRP
jgi:hypothetical protein